MIASINLSGYKKQNSSLLRETSLESQKASSSQIT
jgi:hypothetical protein